MKSITFEIPYPVSVNKMYFNRSSGGRSLTSEARNYKLTVSSLIRYLFPKILFEGDIRVNIMDHPSNRRRDKDNGLKIVFDSIEMSGVIKNDRQIKSFSLTEGEMQKSPRWIVTIESMEKPKDE